MPSSCLVMLDWPERAPELRARVLAALEACDARALSPGVFQLPVAADALDRLGPLLDEVRAAGGRVMLADVSETGSSSGS